MNARHASLHAAALALLLAAGAAACGGEEQSSGAEAVPSAEAPDTVAGAGAETAASGQGPGGHATAADLPLDSLASRARTRAKRMRRAAGHFRQMKKSVEASPELEEQMGTSAQLDAAIQTAELAAALAEDYAELAERVGRAAADREVTARPGMEERLGGIRAQMEKVGVALEEIAGHVRALEDVVHGRGGERHGHGDEDHAH